MTPLRMGVTLLDGAGLAARRAAGIAAGAAEVRTRRGRAPALLLMAFAGGHGRVPHVQGKLRASAATGIEAVPLVVAAGASTRDVVNALGEAIEAFRPDAVFVQVPFPDQLDGDVIAAAIPVEADVDIMSPQRIHRFMSEPHELPPVTVSAALLLLAAHDVSLEGRRGIMVAETSPFSQMFRETLRRRGAVMEPLLDPSSPELAARVKEADLVVAAAGRPGLLHAGMLARGAIALDAGYFNAGARGDIDLSAGTDHLAAVMPVPGGVGPMTVSALLERVVAFSG